MGLISSWYISFHSVGFFLLDANHEFFFFTNFIHEIEYVVEFLRFCVSFLDNEVLVKFMR